MFEIEASRKPGAKNLVERTLEFPPPIHRRGWNRAPVLRERNQFDLALCPYEAAHQNTLLWALAIVEATF